jgi:hypothetical protein
LAETNGTIIFSSGSSINGNWATAASAQTGGVIIFQSGSAINPAFGGGGTALIANGSGGGQPSQIIATGLSVNMNGDGGNVGAKATGGGVITLNSGTTINFAAGGGGNTGLWATGAGSQIVTTGTNLTMIGGGGGDTGVRADTGANVTLSGGAVTVQSNGGGETGLMASGAGSSINATGLAVNVSSNGGARGAFLQNGAAMELTNGSVTTSGPGTFGFLFQAPTGVTNTLTLDGTNVSSAADAFAVQGGTANIATTNATVTGNNGILLSAQNAVVTMTATSSNLTGAILTDAASTSTVTLANATTWTVTGNSNVTSLNNNSYSLISFTAPTGDPTQLASYKRLTAVNYTGAGGRILLNTFLGGDGSPSDRLIINGGTATGTTTQFATRPARGARPPATVFWWSARSTTAPRRQVRSRSLGKCAAAPSTMIYSGAASTTSIPTTGSCARLWAARRGPGNRRSAPFRRWERCHRAFGRSPGRSLRPTVWRCRPPGKWACERSARCTNASATR